MPTCEKKSERRRPKLSELPGLFRQHGGDLTALAKARGYTNGRQARNWINDAHPNVKAQLEIELEAARADAKRGEKTRKQIPLSIPLSEIKALVFTFYHTPWHVLQILDREDLQAQGQRAACVVEDNQEKLLIWRSGGSSSILGKPNPSTSLSLPQRLSWIEVKGVLEALNEADEHALMAWANCGNRSRLAQRLAALDPPSPVPTHTNRQVEKAMRKVYQHLAPLVIQDKSRIGKSWGDVLPHRPASQDMPEGCERAGSDFLGWLYKSVSAP